MSAKLNIKIYNHELIVEGEEPFVQKIFNEFKDIILNSKVGLPIKQPEEACSISPELETEDAPKRTNLSIKSKQKKSSTSSLRVNYNTISEFLNGDDGIKFLKEIEAYEIPLANEKAATLFIYIMKHIGIAGVTLNHVYTAYRLANKEAPNVLKGVVGNARTRLSAVITDDWDDLKTNHIGEKMVLKMKKNPVV